MKHDLVVAADMQHEDAFEALADLPGVNRNDIDLKVSLRNTQKAFELGNIRTLIST